MKSLLLPMALTELSLRNSAMLAAYREWARRLTPGPVSRLTSSIIEQRFELGKALGEAASELSAATLPSARSRIRGRAIPAALIERKLASPEPMRNLKFFYRPWPKSKPSITSSSPRVAGAVLSFSSVIAERLAGEAESARKRSNWAQDHLDLLSMG